MSTLLYSDPARHSPSDPVFLPVGEEQITVTACTPSCTFDMSRQYSCFYHNALIQFFQVQHHFAAVRLRWSIYSPRAFCRSRQVQPGLQAADRVHYIIIHLIAAVSDRRPYSSLYVLWTAPVRLSHALHHRRRDFRHGPLPACMRQSHHMVQRIMEEQRHTISVKEVSSTPGTFVSSPSVA